MLPREDVAIVIQGNKITSDVSHLVRFHISKKKDQNLLADTKKWLHNCFDEVDWEHLDLAMASKSNMYKIWRSKQHSGFCRTRDQVGKYSGLECRDEKCPNCGCRETTAHILICPNKDRTRLSTDTTNDLSKWLSQEYLTNLELAYWIPKYILMRGNKAFASLGTMSPKMRALAVSQNKIEWRNFMEGCISTHFYFIQHYHLALSGSYLNGSDWTKSLISKLLHITYLQWIYHNFTLNDKLFRYLHKNTIKDIRLTIEELAETSTKDVPKESKFLLEINFGELTKSHIKNQRYWIIPLQATITAGGRSTAAGSQAKRIRQSHHKLPSRTKLGITAAEMQIQRDCMHPLQMTTHPFCTLNPPSPNSSLSVPTWQTFLHSTAPTNAFAT